MRNINAILREDTKRRNARQAMEDAILGLGLKVVDESSDAYKIAHNTVRGSRVNPCLVRGIGTVNPPPNTSASDNCWNRGMRGKTVGIAPGTEDSSDGTPTVRVIRNGQEEIVPANRFGRSSGKRKSTKANAVIQPETAKLKIVGGHDFN